MHENVLTLGDGDQLRRTSNPFLTPAREATPKLMGVLHDGTTTEIGALGTKYQVCPDEQPFAEQFLASRTQLAMLEAQAVKERQFA
jgi:hypothetical protein